MSRRNRRPVTAFYPQAKGNPEIVKISPKNKSRRKSINFASLLEECNAKMAELESYNETCHKTNEQLNQVHQEYKKLANMQIDALRLQLDKLTRAAKRRSVKYNPSSNPQVKKRRQWSKPTGPLQIAEGNFTSTNTPRYSNGINDY